MLRTRRYTLEEFDEFVRQPENADRLFEYIGGDIVEMVSMHLASQIGMFIGSMLTLFVAQHQLGWVTGADGGYIVSGEKYIPDAAYISKKKQSRPSREAYNPIPPDLAVEVLSPSNKPEEMRIKLVNYLLAGVMVWMVDPDLRQIEVYVPGKPAQKLGIADVLSGGDVLPGFSLAVEKIFAGVDDTE